MNNLFESFTEFKEAKNINRQEIMNILEDVFRNVIVKKFGSDENFDIIVNTDQGDLEIFQNREVVEDDCLDYNPNLHIKYSEVIKYEPDFEVGEEYTSEIKLSEFGHRTILGIKQNLLSKVMDLQKSNIYNEYQKRIGEIITGEVIFANKREAVIQDSNNNELVLPRYEQMPSDFYRKGDYVKAVVISVENENKPKVVLSRRSEKLLEHLLEFEIPEIMDGLITIKSIVRIAGEKSKVMVECYDDRVDPIGICVGSKGSRLFTIKKELNGENIDIINYTQNSSLLIQRALSPAKSSLVKIDEETMKALVSMKSDQIALAIGKGGVNIRLARLLTGYDIEVYSEDAELVDDVVLDEFSDEIDEWIINTFKEIGLDSAKSILNLSVAELVRRTDLEEETIEEILRILGSEFE
jgi:N utilization substance protein A